MFDQMGGYVNPSSTVTVIFCLFFSVAGEKSSLHLVAKLFFELSWDIQSEVLEQDLLVIGGAGDAAFADVDAG